MKVTYRAALLISAVVENQGSVDRVEGDPRGILRHLERIWDLIDAARSRQEPDGGQMSDDAVLDVPFSIQDLRFIDARVEEASALTRELLAEESLDQQTRRDQEESLDAAVSAIEEVRRLIAAQA